MQQILTTDQLTSGNFEFGAGVSAVAIKSGASGSVGTAGATASASSGSGKTGAGTAGNYRKGMAVFTIAKGGLMYEASQPQTAAPGSRSR